MCEKKVKKHTSENSKNELKRQLLSYYKLATELMASNDKIYVQLSKTKEFENH